MDVTLPEKEAEIAQEMVDSGDFASIDEVLAAGVTVLHEQNADAESVRRGLADLDAGRVSPLEKVLTELGTKYQHDLSN